LEVIEQGGQAKLGFLTDRAEILLGYRLIKPKGILRLSQGLPTLGQTQLAFCLERTLRESLQTLVEVVGRSRPIFFFSGDLAQIGQGIRTQGIGGISAQEVLQEAGGLLGFTGEKGGFAASEHRFAGPKALGLLPEIFAKPLQGILILAQL
jgi:hypothetical protein